MYRAHPARRNLLRLRVLEHLVQSIELGSLGSMAEVARVDDEIRLLRKPIDLFNSGFECRRHPGLPAC